MPELEQVADVLEDQTPVETPEGETPSEEVQDPAAEQTEQEPEEPAVPEFLKGTSFKKPEALVKSYKDIQRLVSSKDNQLREVNRQLLLAKRYLQQLVQQRPQQGETKEDFWARFWEKPEDPIGRIVDERVERAIGPLRQHADQGRIYSAIQEFKEGLAEDGIQVTKADEGDMAEIITANQWMQGLPPSTRLEIAWEKLQLKRQRESAATQQVDAAKASGALGSKTGAASHKKQPKKDEFDLVMGAADAERKLFGRG